jgi:alpha,alpha-trehalose phosphorylase
MALVYGLAGMRDHDGRLSFAPRMPGRGRRLSFPITFRNQRLLIDIQKHEVTYSLAEGTKLHFHHCGEEIALKAGETATRPLSESP